VPRRVGCLRAVLQYHAFYFICVLFSSRCTILAMTQGNSKIVTSNQQGIHPNLESAVRRHLAHANRKPFSEHTLAAFAQAQAWIGERENPLILDACCGTGESTLTLAQQHPDALVIGIDKSIHRLQKHHGGSDSYLLLQADLNDFWRLARHAGWQLYKHYLLYPNPYPKSVHFKRRWHASPAFPDILALGGELTVRSNWRLYVEEFVAALGAVGVDALCSEYVNELPITAFERKYWLSGQRSWQLCVEL
jgi:tRNA (guanine-N7-)-methyltransferase